MTATVEVVGKAIYLETKYEDYSYDRVEQIIILPSYKSDSGIEHYPTIMTRDVSQYSPRAQWQFEEYLSTFSSQRELTSDEENESHWNPTSKETHRVLEGGYEITKGTPWNDEQKNAQAEYNALSKEEQVSRMVNAMAYELKSTMLRKDSETGNLIPTKTLRNGKPMVVEVTNEEMEKAVAGETPQSLIRRIQKVRVANGLPEKIITPA